MDIESIKSRTVEQWMAMDREARLVDVNALLASMGLRQFPSLGKVEEGQAEFVAIEQIDTSMGRFYVDIKFTTLFPAKKDGQWVRGAFKPRFNANGALSDGAVIVCTVNGQFAIVREWRPSLMAWVNGFPRGFSDKLDGLAKGQVDASQIGLADLAGPLATLKREFSEEVMANAHLVGAVYLGRVWQNSGTDNVAPDFFWVQLEVPADQLSKRLGGTEGLQVKLWSADKVASEVGYHAGRQGSLCDGHTLSAVALVMMHQTRQANLARFMASAG